MQGRTRAIVAKQSADKERKRDQHVQEKSVRALFLTQEGQHLCKDMQTCRRHGVSWWNATMLLHFLQTSFFFFFLLLSSSWCSWYLWKHFETWSLSVRISLTVSWEKHVRSILAVHRALSCQGTKIWKNFITRKRLRWPTWKCWSTSPPSFSYWSWCPWRHNARTTKQITDQCTCATGPLRMVLYIHVPAQVLKWHQYGTSSQLSMTSAPLWHCEVFCHLSFGW